MIDKFLFKISDWHNEILRKKGILNDENYSDIDYIFRSNFWNLFVFLVFFMIGLAIDILPEIMWLFVSFNVLRDKCGGWHSYGNLTYCFISSTIIFLLLAIFCKNFNGLGIYLVPISVFFIIYTFIKAPIMQKEEMYQDKWQFKFDYLILSICFVLASYYSGYLICCCCSIIICGLYMSKTFEKINLFVRGIIFNE